MHFFQLNIKHNLSGLLLTIAIITLITIHNTILQILAISCALFITFIFNKSKNISLNTVLIIAVFSCLYPIRVHYEQTPFNCQKTSPLIITTKITDCAKTHSKKNKCIAKYKNKKIIFIHDNLETIKPGDIVKIEGEAIPPRKTMNPGEFNHFKYLKNKNISCRIKAKKIKKIDHQQINLLRHTAYKLKDKIIQNNRKTLPFPYCELFTSLIFGDKGVNLPKKLKTDFQKAGLTHLLVVSGTQVAILSTVINILISLIRLSPFSHIAIMGLTNIFFFYLTGGGASILRAILMSQVMQSLHRINHNPHPLHILSFTGLLMLIFDPNTLFDIGAQLSFFATFSLLYSSQYLAQAMPNKWPLLLKNSLSCSIAPFLFTLPLIWYHFNQLSLISILLNFLTIAWIELLVIIGFISTLLGLIWLPLCDIINQSCYIIIKILVLSVELSSQWTHSIVYIKKPTIPTIISLYLIFIIKIYAQNITKWKKNIILTSLIIFISLNTIIPWIKHKNKLKATFLYVGQGDSTVIQSPSGKTIIIDTGLKISIKDKTIVDKGAQVILPFLRFNGINKVDLLILTHFDKDHIGGTESLLNNITVDTIIHNGNIKKIPNSLMKTIQKLGTTMITANANMEIKFKDELKLKFIHPLTNSKTNKYKNNNSIAMKLNYKDTSFLFTGDLEEEKEILLTNIYKESLKSNVLKLGHHGSKTSTTMPFLYFTKPQLCIISAGIKNKFNHPHPLIIKRAKSFGCTVLRTDQNGAIEVESNGKKIQYKSFKNNK